jgi:hypothetical protein
MARKTCLTLSRLQTGDQTGLSSTSVANVDSIEVLGRLRSPRDRRQVVVVGLGQKEYTIFVFSLEVAIGAEIFQKLTHFHRATYEV